MSQFIPSGAASLMTVQYAHARETHFYPLTVNKNHLWYYMYIQLKVADLCPVDGSDAVLVNRLGIVALS